MCDVSETFIISLPKPKLQPSAAVNEKEIAGHPVLNYSFVDKLWNFEISGGKDQNAPITVVSVKSGGLARRSGIKVGDEIAFINNVPTENMTLLDAQLEIQEAGKSLKIVVRGDRDDSSSEDELTTDFWFKPMTLEQINLVKWNKRQDEKRKSTKQVYQNTFPWNDRKKPSLRSSNCFMASNKVQEREIKLKVAKERYNVFEKARLTEVENQTKASSK